MTAAHLSPGIVGSLAVPIAATPEMLDATGGYAGLLAAQAAMVIAAGVWSFGTMFGAVKLIDAFWRIRVSEEDEHRGLDQAEHGMVSELAMIRRELKARLHQALVQGGPGIERHSETGQMMEVISEAVDSFREKQNAWRGQIAQLEAANGLLRTRTVDLEKALVGAEASLQRSMDRLRSNAAEFQEQIEALECREDGRKRILDYVATTAAACARLIGETGQKPEPGEPIGNGKHSLAKVKRIAEALASDLEDFVQLCRLAENEFPPSTEFLAVNDTLLAALREFEGKSKKRVMDNLALSLGASLPRLLTNPESFAELARCLLGEALSRCSPKAIEIGSSVDVEGLHIVIRGRGASLDEEEIAVLLDPIASIEAGRMSSGRISFRLGLASLLARRLEATLSVTSGEVGGLACVVSFPNKQLQQIARSSERSNGAVASS